MKIQNDDVHDKPTDKQAKDSEPVDILRYRYAFFELLRPCVCILSIQSFQVEVSNCNHFLILHQDPAITISSAQLSSAQLSSATMMMMMNKFLLLTLLVAPLSNAFTLSSKPVSQLLSEKAATIDSLKVQAAKTVDITQEPFSNDVFFLRYCLKEEPDEASTKLALHLDWRTGDGKAICDSAQAALKAATADGGWKNDIVMNAAPFSAKILKYLTPSNILTTATSQGDLICCILAGSINDVDLMKAVSIEEMVDFFVYAKEINCVVTNTRSLKSDKLQCLLTANSLEGVKLIGGEAKFRTALSGSSKVTDPIYPNYNGPTLLLNLPSLLGALVKIFTPLFPPNVRERLRFVKGPLLGNLDLTQVLQGGAERPKFLKDIDGAIYND